MNNEGVTKGSVNHPIASPVSLVDVTPVVEKIVEVDDKNVG
jgi:hypothetical protein